MLTGNVCFTLKREPFITGLKDVKSGANPGIIWAYRFFALQKLSAEGTEFIDWGAL